MRRTIAVAFVVALGSIAYSPALGAQSVQGFNPGMFYVPPVKIPTPQGFYIPPVKISTPGGTEPKFKVPLHPLPFANDQNYSGPIPNVTRNLAKPQKISPMVITPDPTRAFR